MSAELRTSIADAIADVWGDEEPTSSAREYDAQLLRELYARVPTPKHHLQGKWHPRTTDSAITLLTYRRGQVPELDIPQQGLREEFRDWITKAVGRAVALAINRKAVGTPMPLQFAGVDDREVTLELRFGGSPRPNAAVVTFTRQEREAWPRPGNRGPYYPDEYRINNVQGEVKVAFIIDTAGAVERGSIRVLSSDGPLFDTSVRRALIAMRFQPLMIDCEPHAMPVIQPFNFTLTR